MAAVVALASVAVHVWMAWGHRSVPWEGALMLLMAAACLPCSLSVWRHGTDRAVRMLFAMALGMVAWHAALVLAPGAMAGHGHDAMGSIEAGSMGSASMGLMTADATTAAGPAAGTTDAGAWGAMGPDAMLAVIALELAVAALAAWALRRSRLRAAA